MAIERTLSIIKPDAVAKNVIGQIYARFEGAGLKIIAARMAQLSRSEAEAFYAVHRERPFYGDLVAFMEPYWNSEELTFVGSSGVTRGFDETLRVLLRLREAGSFPFRASGRCRYCAFDAACRRNHPPTQDRERLRPDGRDYVRLSKKSLKAPLLGSEDGP